MDKCYKVIVVFSSPISTDSSLLALMLLDPLHCKENSHIFKISFQYSWRFVSAHFKFHHLLPACDSQAMPGDRKVF